MLSRVVFIYCLFMYCIYEGMSYNETVGITSGHINMILKWNYEYGFSVLL